ncbi:iron-containing alcohol dehydrogenase [Rubeoparvulum massiliense]|uniref:iron-containing alcohol dehydrogenase n=1 Tax=Rubeoparvulum massiliense TaxID=1631346 RepID=UPI00065E91D7|nr:iron-containing alcohol dehydrogenase [Rubeoparvulum massiliense]
METFQYYNPTRLIFGKDTVTALKDEVPKYGKRVLLVYGGGSIKRNGLYDRVIEQLNTIDAEVFELPGVEPNPRLTMVEKGAALCREHKIEFLLAVGGGSTIDCTKAIAVAALHEGDFWQDVIIKHEAPKAALPLGTILTLAATGSEMNSGSVITNWETQEKYGWGTPLVYPKFSILDPENTFSVPKDQTINGMVDMMAHVFEHYFHISPNAPLQERLCESVLQTVIETAPKLVNDLHNFQLRETILFSGTMALNGMINMGIRGDWATHNLEHAVSAVYDIPHGGGLAILFPNWMKHVMDEKLDRVKQLAIRVWNVDPTGKSDREVALEGIERLRQFWTELGAPARLANYEIDDSQLDLLVEKAMAFGPFGRFKVLNHDDVAAIYRASL